MYFFIDLSKPIITFKLRLKDSLAEHLRLARGALGLKQVEFAHRTGVSRATQIGYEKGVTEPTTAYLRAVQEQGIDLGSLLFEEPTNPPGGNGASPDWALIQHCSETVDFFCLRVAPACPASYRWEMTRKLYSKMSNKTDTNATEPAALEVLSKIWSDYV
jgi:transcriptional regulator with XRE-family HTH domain